MMVFRLATFEALNLKSMAKKPWVHFRGHSLGLLRILDRGRSYSRRQLCEKVSGGIDVDLLPLDKTDWEIESLLNHTLKKETPDTLKGILILCVFFFLCVRRLQTTSFDTFFSYRECFFFGNRLFYFQTNRERKIENKKIGCKKKFPQFLLSMYVLCVCLFVCWRSTDVIV